MTDTDSPIFAVKHWRNLPQEEQDALDSFLFWLEYDIEEPDETVKKIKVLINNYLGRDMEKIKQGESLLLRQWIEAQAD